MGRYTEVADLYPFLGRYRKDLTDTSTPSISDVDVFIADFEKQVEAAFNARGFPPPLVVPAIPLELLDWITTTVAIGAAAHTIGALLPHSSGPQGTMRDDRLWTLFNARIKLVDAGTVIPIIIGGVGTITLPRSYETSNSIDEETGDFWATQFPKHVKW